MTDLIPREPTEVEAADAHARHERIKAALTEMRRLWTVLAKELYEFAGAQEWRALGYDSFEAYLASPDIDLSRPVVFNLIQIHRELVVNRGVSAPRLAEVEWSKLRETLPAIRRGHVTVDEAIADAEATSFRDLRERYKLITAGSPGDPEPAIDPEGEPVWVICPACGQRMPTRSAS